MLQGSTRQISDRKLLTQAATNFKLFSTVALSRPAEVGASHTCSSLKQVSSLKS